jgi:peptide/nickel transport system permease protein
MDNVFNWGDPVIGVARTYLSTNIRKGVIWSNTQQYKNPKVDELLNAAAVETDLEKRKALYSEFQKIVVSEAPIAYINLTPYKAVYDKRLTNLPPVDLGAALAPRRGRLGAGRRRSRAMTGLRRLGATAANAAGLLLAVVVLNFLLIQAAPGDPAQVIAGEMGGASPEIMAEIRTRYGLDRGLPEQLATYVGKVVRGDLGYSFYFNEPVSRLILGRLPATALLVLSSLALAVLAGAGLGILGARRPNGLVSHAVSLVAIAGNAAPVFWTGLMLLVVFASLWPVLPVAGMEDVATPRHGLAYALDVARHLVLPALTLGIVYVAQYSRLMRASMIDALNADYVRTAPGQGPAGADRDRQARAAQRADPPRHHGRAPVRGSSSRGAILVETVFAWPGLGRLTFDSILRRDYPTLLGILFCSALLVIAANLVTDLLYRLIDPRIRAGRPA